MSDTLFSDLETPWPILISSEIMAEEDPADYPNSDCEFSVVENDDPEKKNVIFAVDYTVQDPVLVKMLEANQLTLRAIVRSQATNYRTVYTLKSNHFKISRKLIRDSVEITLFATATDTIEDFSSETLTATLAEATYQIQKHGIMIYFGSQTIPLKDPDSNSLQFQECFKIRKKEDLTGFEFDYDESDDDTFFVYVSDAAFMSLESLSYEQKPMVALTSFIIPALAMFLTRKGDEPSLKEHDSKYWAKQLAIKLQKADYLNLERLSTDSSFALMALGRIFNDQYEQFISTLASIED